MKLWWSSEHTSYCIYVICSNLSNLKFELTETIFILKTIKMLPRASPQIGVFLAWPPTANFATMTTWTRRRVSVATVSGQLATPTFWQLRKILGTNKIWAHGKIRRRGSVSSNRCDPSQIWGLLEGGADVWMFVFVHLSRCQTFAECAPPNMS